MSNSMSPKTATRRLYVAMVSLVASILELAAALVRLGVALLGRATAAIRARVERPVAAPADRPRLRIVPKTDGRTRLTFALIGMGFHAPLVRSFVNELGDRVDREPIGTLIKEGLAALAA
jgi:hypothetical protein